MTTDTLERFREKKLSLARATTEAEIVSALALADEAVRIWDEEWEAALGNRVSDCGKEAEILRSVLGEAEQALRNALRSAQDRAHLFERPLARLDELETRTSEFPLWARECLVRWEMLSRPPLTLDPERIARAQAA